MVSFQGFLLNSYAQNTAVEDSLLNIIATTDSLKLKIETYAKLHSRFTVSDKDKSLYYLKKAHHLSQSTNNKKLLTDINARLGWYITNTIEKPDEARPYLDASYKFASQLNDSIRIGKALTYIGFTYQMKSYYRAALNYYLKSLDYYENATYIDSTEKKRLAFSYNLIGEIYEFQGLYEKSLEYHFKALELRKKYAPTRHVSHSLKNIGWTHFKAKDYSQSIKAFNECIEITKTYKHLKRLSFAYNGLGSNYLALNKLDSSLIFFQKALEINKIIKIDFNTAQTNVGISKAYLAKNDLKKAFVYANKTLEVIEDHRYYEQQKDANYLLFKVKEKEGNMTQALNYFKTYQQINDSINSKETKLKIAEMEFLFNTEKKERELAELKGESLKKTQQLEKEENKRNQLALALAAITFLLITFTYSLRNNIHKKRLLQASVNEKNALLKETHHRVKNSFQIVSSLLFLQASTIDNKDAEKAIKEAQNRVNSMVLLHQKLYKKEHVSGVDCEDYISALVMDIIDSNSIAMPHIQKTLNIEPMVLDITTAASIGLIINELVTNSLKHAFPNKKKDARIDVSLVKSENTILLSVEDNGIGMTKIKKGNTVGIALIEDLAKKIKGVLKIENLQKHKPKGTKVSLTIHKYELL